MQAFLLVALGGAIGSMGRYGVTQIFLKLLGKGFPWQTVFVNVVGSFIMGLITGLVISKLHLSDHFKTFLTVGVLGGFTTFSSFSLDFAELVEGRQMGPALFYLVFSVVISILAVFAGLALGRG